LREHSAAIALVTITAVAAAIRFATLGQQSFDHDEAVTAWRVLHPSLWATLGVTAHLERTPPLYYLLAWLWSKAAGTGQIDLRMLSAIFGTLTIPVAFLAGRELGSRRAGLVAAAFVAVNPFLVWYSQEARAYALLVLLGALGLYLFARALRTPSERNLTLWVVASGLALCTHYFAVFVVVPEAIWLIAATRPRRRTGAATAMVGAVGLALLPLAVLQEGAGRLNGFRVTPVLERGLQTVIHFAASAEPQVLAGGWIGALQITAGIGAAGIAIAATALLWRAATRAERRDAAVAAGVGAAAFAVPIALALGGLDYVDSRNMIGALVPLLVAAGIACGARRAGRAGLAVAAGACTLFAAVLVAVALSPAMQRPDWRQVARAVGPSPGTRVLVVPRLGEDPIAYYLHADDFKLGADPVFTRRLDAVSRGPHVQPPDPRFNSSPRGCSTGNYGSRASARRGPSSWPPRPRSGWGSRSSTRRRCSPARPSPAS
jgi:mannosyltransferase